MGTTGGWRDVKDFMNSKEILDLGRFAVDEHNKQQNGDISFRRVVTAQEQVVAGTMYQLTIEAEDGDHPKLYKAKVWVKPWENFKRLEEFKPVEQPSVSRADLGVKQETLGIRSSSGAAAVGITGGWSDVKDIQNSKEILDLGRFAVDEHNKQQNGDISFRRVVAAQKQLVAGMNYQLTIEAEDGDHPKLYKAKVFVGLREKSKCLKEFKPVEQSSVSSADLGVKQGS